METSKKSLILKIVLSVVCFIVVIFLAFAAVNAFTSSDSGDILVEYVDAEDNVVKQKVIKFNKGDLLVELIKENFENVTLDNGMIMTIEDFITPNDWSYFISIYVDDKMSNVGINQIQFKGGMKISLKITKFDNNYE